MPTRALSMRKIRELIRLKYEAGLSHEQIARALAISKGVVAKYVARLERSGLEPAVLLALSGKDSATLTLPLTTPAGIATLIWYRPTEPGLRPAKEGVAEMVPKILLPNSTAGVAVSRASGSEPGAGTLVPTAGFVGPKPIA